MWQLLSPAQKFSVLVGVPVVMLMLRGAGIAVCYLVPWPWLELLILLPMYFILPYVYVRGIGSGVAAIFDLLIKIMK